MKTKLPEKQSLGARLSSYAAAAGALSVLSSLANGQVVYSGPQNLELNMPLDSVEIDIDSNEVNDFKFKIGSYIGSNIGSYFSYQVSIVYGAIFNARTDLYNSWLTKMTTVSFSSNVYENPVVDGLGFGEMVDSVRSSWAAFNQLGLSAALGISYFLYLNIESYGTLTRSWTAGEFKGEEKFIGVRFYIDEEQHYGWIRVSLSDAIETLTIVDWAYESTAGEMIQAGDGLGIDLPPGLRITGGGGATSNAARTLNIDATEEIDSLTVDDLIVTNGLKSNFTEVTPGWEYSVDITALTQGTVTVEIPDSAVVDLSDNPNLASRTSWLYDNISPEVILFTPVISTDEQTIEVSATFSERVYGFELSDILVTNGSASNLSENETGLEYTFDVTAEAEGVVVVSLPAGSTADIAGNENEPASTNWTYTIPPVAIDMANTEVIQIYPNPVSSTLHIELENQATVQIVDLNGKVVYRQEHLLNESIDISMFNPGVYIVQIQDNEKITQHKIIIE